MSETLTQPAPVTPAAPGSDPAPVGTGEASVTPEGYVPLAEAEKTREEARRNAQAVSDLRAEIARLKAPAPTAPKTDGDLGFDPDAFRQSLLRDVYGASQLDRASTQLKAEFPHADPAIFSPEKLSEFASPEALRFAAQDSHARVAAILSAETERIQTEIRAEIAARLGDGGAGTGAGVLPAGDPTVAQLAAMSPDELNALEVSNPGVAERVLLSAERSAAA